MSMKYIQLIWCMMGVWWISLGLFGVIMDYYYG
jgi:hypothetical protein